MQIAKQNVFWTLAALLGTVIIFGLMFYENGVLAPLLEGDLTTGLGLIAFFVVAIFGIFALGVAIVWAVVFPFVSLYRSSRRQ